MTRWTTTRVTDQLHTVVSTSAAMVRSRRNARIQAVHRCKAPALVRPLRVLRYSDESRWRHRLHLLSASCRALRSMDGQMNSTSLVSTSAVVGLRSYYGGSRNVRLDCVRSCVHIGRTIAPRMQDRIAFNLVCTSSASIAHRMQGCIAFSLMYTWDASIAPRMKDCIAFNLVRTSDASNALRTLDILRSILCAQRMLP